jgi:hypothetical protein
MGQAFGQMGGGMQGAMGQMGFGGAQGGAGRPTVRNAVLVFLIPILGGFLQGVLGGIGGATGNDTIASIMSGIGGLVYLAALILTLINIIKMANELKAVTGNPSFAWWPIFIPCYNYYWMWVAVPQEMAKAKQMRGIQTPPRNFFIYFLFFLYAFAADLNDIAKAP